METYNIYVIKEPLLTVYSAAPESVRRMSGDGELEAVEMGLSLGELRQSILDRIKQETRKGHFEFLRPLIAEGLEIVEDPFRTSATAEKQIFEKIEEMIYDNKNIDSLLKGVVWEFSNETIFIDEE